jgi:hypothetical protein
MKNAQNSDEDEGDWDVWVRVSFMTALAITFAIGFVAVAVAALEHTLMRPEIYVIWIGSMIFLGIVLIVYELRSIFEKILEMKERLRQPTSQLPPENSE